MFQPPKKKLGIADRIRAALAGNKAGMEARREKFAPKHAMSDDTRVARRDRDPGLADRVEREQRAAMQPDSFDRKFGYGKRGRR